MQFLQNPTFNSDRFKNNKWHIQIMFWIVWNLHRVYTKVRGKVRNEEVVQEPHCRSYLHIVEIFPLMDTLTKILKILLWKKNNSHHSFRGNLGIKRQKWHEFEHSVLLSIYLSWRLLSSTNAHSLNYCIVCKWLLDNIRHAAPTWEHH